MTIRFRVLLLAVLLSAELLAAARASSGHDLIDRYRQEAAAAPTTPPNARERQAWLYAWFRLLLHQGVDVREFIEIRRALGPNWQEATPAICRAIDKGYAMLERVQAAPVKFTTLKGGPAGGVPSPPTDWPVFHGNPGQTGFTRDPGPQIGEPAWRFPVGHTWYAAPSVENGRVYIASPGMLTSLYCLDERTGKVIWRTLQNGWQIYETPRVSSPVIVLKDHLVIRESGSRGETGVARDLVLVEKATGRVVKEHLIGHLDYRHGYAPVAGGDRFLLYPYGQQFIENVPPLVWNLDTVMSRHPRTGQTLWALRLGDISGDIALDGDSAFVATDSGVLYNLNATGQERIRWQTPLGAPLRGTPLVTAAAVYVGANDGKLHALDRADGRVRWTFQAPGAPGRAHRFFSNTAAAGERIFVGAANSFLYCLDAASGKPLWQHKLGDWVRSRPVVVGDSVYAASMDGTVTALRASGPAPEVRWRKKVTTHQILADLVAAPQGLLASTNDLYLVSLNPASGDERWRHSLIECAYIDGERVPADMIAGGADYQSSPTVVRGKVYFGAPNRFVYALDSESGKEIWRFETSGQVSGTPMTADGRVFFGQQGGDKDFYAVDAATGELQWKRALGWAWVGASQVRGRLIVGTVEGDIHAVRPESGEVLWTRQTTGGVYPSPATDGHSVFTGAWGGHYFALDPEDGHMRWAFYVPKGPHPFPQRAVISPDSGAPIATGGRVFFGPGPTAYSLDAATGNPLWEYSTGNGLNFNVSPATDGERIYISTKIDVNGCNLGARMIALDAASGKPVWEHEPGGGITGAAVTGGRVCFASSSDPHATCVDPRGNPDGTTRMLWRYRAGGVVEESCPAIYGDKMYYLGADRYFHALR